MSPPDMFAQNEPKMIAQVEIAQNKSSAEHFFCVIEDHKLDIGSFSFLGQLSGDA